MRRIRLTVAAVLGWVLLTPAPASAHSVAGVSGTNYRTTLHSAAPAVPGIRVRVIETGSRLELSNTTGGEAVVLGYQDEPYLRVGPDGVFENLRSPATYMNADRKGTTPIPSSASPTAPPQWRKVSSGTTARWHDHRIHWMGDRDPPVVRRAPGRSHVVVPEWRVQIQVGGQTVAATGDLTWVPGPTIIPWLVLAVLLLGACLLAGLSRSWARALLALLVAAVVVDVVHAVGIGFANEGSTALKVGRVLAGSFFSVVAWAAAVMGARQLARRSGDGLLVTAFVGAVIGLFGGLADLPSLFSSQVPFAFPAGLARAAVGVSLGLGFGLVAGSVLAIVRHRVFAPEPEPAPPAS